MPAENWLLALKQSSLSFNVTKDLSVYEYQQPDPQVKFMVTTKTS